MRAISLLMLLMLPAVSFAKDASGTALFKSGLRAFGEGKYEAALSDFEESYRTLPEVGDYILLYISRTQAEMGETEASLKNARELLSKYPRSLLRKKARSLEVRNVVKSGGDGALDLLESYIDDYPSDGGARLLYGRLLKESGNEKDSNAVLKALYMEAGPQSSEAYGLLTDRDLSGEESIARAENLIKAARYAEAEKILKSLLQEDNHEPGGKILDDLATTLFRQKKYSESAGMFLELDDLYNASLSFLRSGREDEFYSTLDAMVSKKDEKGAELMIALADELRRDGDAGNALSILTEAMAVFPSITEEALWRTGWTHYTGRKYEKAALIFRRLYETYKSNKYLYWQARSLEKSGKDASELYGLLSDTDFYTFMARRKSGLSDLPPLKPNGVKKRRLPMKRIDILIEVGLTEEAAGELAAMSRRDTRYSAILTIAYKFRDIREYRRAMLLTDLLPDGMRPHEILYPLAYWSTVQEVSSAHGIDPFLLLSLMREESRFDPEALSPAGAIGLMQLMPGTARRAARNVDVKINGRQSIQEVDNNIRLGAHYLSGLLDEFKSVSAALAAYNAGERRVRKWLKSGGYESYDEFVEDIPYEETRNYVKRIMTTYFRYQVARYPEFTGSLDTL